MSLPELSKPEAAGFSSSRLARINGVVDRYVDQGKLAGAITLVARRGQVVHLRAAGLQDREAGRPMTEETIFRIYSMTKPITTVAAMMLFEAGHFLLDDPVADYLPAFKETKVWVGNSFSGLRLEAPQRSMTIKDLMCHTAGLSYGWFKDSPVDALYAEHKLSDPDRDLADMVDTLAQLPLLYHPGTAWRYSYATDVLGRLVEVVSGRPLDEFFRDAIFQPLGMVDTGFHVPAAKLARLAAVYSPGKEFDFTAAMAEKPQADSEIAVLDAPVGSPFTRVRPFRSGGGGLVSTMADYLRFAQMLLNRGVLDGRRLLGRKTVELMMLNHLPAALVPIGIGGDVNHGYGFGLGGSVLVDVAASSMPGSPGLFGWGGAAGTQFWVDPQEDLIGLLMIQFMPSGYYPIRREFRGAVYQALVD